MEKIIFQDIMEAKALLQKLSNENASTTLRYDELGIEINVRLTNFELVPSKKKYPEFEEVPYFNESLEVTEYITDDNGAFSAAVVEGESDLLLAFGCAYIEKHTQVPYELRNSMSVMMVPGPGKWNLAIDVVGISIQLTYRVKDRIITRFQIIPKNKKFTHG